MLVVFCRVALSDWNHVAQLLKVSLSRSRWHFCICERTAFFQLQGSQHSQNTSMKSGNFIIVRVVD